MASSDLWSVLLPVIIGGVLALLGGALAPAVAHWLSSRAAKRDKQLERFEELVSVLYEHDNWLERRRKSMYGEEDVNTASPLQRAVAIAALYFPNFFNLIEELDLLSSSYQAWIASGPSRRLAGGINTMNDGFEEAYRPYRIKFLNVQKAITDYAMDRGGVV